MKSIIVLGAALCCSCGGTGAVDPLNITGTVAIEQETDGSSQVFISANVSRPLTDGGVEAAPDARLALNGVPLNDGTIFSDAQGQPATFFFSAAAFAGVVPLAHQTLSVIGANPPAQVSFDCPAPVSVLSPTRGAVLDRKQPVALVWTPGSTQQYLTFSFPSGDAGPGPDGSFQLPSGGIQSVDDGVTSTSFVLPSEASPNANVRLTVTVNGNTPDQISVCSYASVVDVVFP